MSDETLAVHDEFVTFGLAAKNGVIIQYQASLARTGESLKKECSSQSADSSAHNHTIVNFTEVDKIGGQRAELAIANLMPGKQDLECVSVRLAVVTDPAVAVEVFPLRKQFERRQTLQQQISGGQQRAVEEVAAGDCGGHSQSVVSSCVCSHRTFQGIDLCRLSAGSRGSRGAACVDRLRESESCAASKASFPDPCA